jgi:expansin
LIVVTVVFELRRDYKAIHYKRDKDMQSSTNHSIRTAFTVQTEWDKGFTGKLDLTNMGELLTDWTIQFESQFEITPGEIWGAEVVSRSGNIYTLKPVAYNQSIEPQNSTSIFFNANKINGEILKPEKVGLGNIEIEPVIEPNEIEVIPAEDPSNNAPVIEPNEIEEIPAEDPSNNTPVVEPVIEPVVEAIPTDVPGNPELTTEASNDLPVDVSFSLLDDWGSGFQGSISITNTSGSNIDSWNLEFDFPNQINNIWDAAIEENENGSYVITHTAWNREIAAGETITFGFTGDGSVISQPQNYELDGFTFDSPSIDESIYTYENPDLQPELELNQPYQGRATFFDAANPAGGLGNSGFDIPTQDQLHKVVAINNIQWNGSEASGAFMEVSGPKQRDGAASIIVQVTDQLAERADGMDMSAEAFAMVADPTDGIVNINYQLVGPPDDYVTAYGHKIGDGIVVETIAGTSSYYAATRLNNHRYPIESVELIEEDGDLVQLNRESDNRFVMEGNYPLNGVQDLLVTDIFGQQVTLNDIDITNASAPDTITGEQFALI